MMLTLELHNGRVAHFQLDDEGRTEIFRMGEITDPNYQGRLLYPSLEEVLDMIGTLTDREKAILDGIFKEV